MGLDTVSHVHVYVAHEPLNDFFVSSKEKLAKYYLHFFFHFLNSFFFCPSHGVYLGAR